MLGASTAALLAIMGTGPAFAQAAGEGIETVTVTGFRQSLEKALDMKRTALDSSDSIMAEDIAKFPDMNVTESLQRIPGVAITRDSGEGRQITVRGLGAQFSRVRINHMETLTTVGGQDTTTSGGGTNRGRGFDFNVFASELFSQLTIHKSQSASLEEGSLGATVDLQTAHPFDHPGFVFTTSAQYGYQEYGGQSSPRFAALVSDTFLGGRLGFLVSGAYAIQNVLEEGSDNGRWVSDLNTGTAPLSTWQFASVNGLTTGAAFTAANAAFRPRFPRYAIIPLHEKRLGLTGSVQWQPDDDTLFTLDAMYADFAQVRHEYYMEPYALSQAATSGAAAYPRRSGTNCYFSGEAPCPATLLTTVQLYTHAASLINYDAGDIDANNNLTRAELTNVGLRSEQRLDNLDTRFMQLTLDGTHSFSEAFKVHAMAGWSESHHRNPIQTTVTADLGCVNSGTSTACTAGGAGTTSNPFIYDYASGKIPLISMGLTDATDASGWYLSQIRGRSSANFNSFRTAVADFEYTVNSAIKLEGGVDYRNYGYSTFSLRRSMGANTNLDAVIPYPIQSAFTSSPNTYAQLVSLKAISTPAGATTTWWVPNINQFDTDFGIWDQSASHYSFTDYYASGVCDADGTTTETTSASLCGAFNMGIEPDISNNGSVRENDYGGWLQVGWDTLFYGVPFRGNIGGRYILTEQEATGYVLNGVTWAITEQTGKQVYHDFLPALNVVFEPAEDFLMRINASFAMSRPNLSNLMPGGTATVSGGNWTYAIGNAGLKPSRSKNLDLAFEWYYHKGAMLSIALFYKKLDTITKAASGVINWHTGSGLNNPSYYGLTDPSSFAAACGLSLADWNAGVTSTTCGLGYNTDWRVNTTINDKGGPLFGTEINWQQPFDFLPNPLDNFGVLANVTFVQAQQTYISTGTSTYLGDLTGLSRTSYNGTLYYDDTVFQARMTAAFRSHFMIASTMNTLNLGTFAASTMNMDASASYKWDENIMLTLDALNLTNQAMDIYIDSAAKRTNIYHQTGRVVFLGLRYVY